MSLLAKLMDRAGITKTPRYAREAFGYRGIVSKSGEFRRIEALPRREWIEEAQELIEPMTEILKSPLGQMTLRLIQCAALYDIAKYRGAFLPIGVGEGKALISLLAPVVLEAENPLLLVPAALRDQTNQHVIPEMSEHWNLYPGLRVVGYSELSLEKNKDLLFDMKPDVIIADEAHYLKHKTSGRTKRMVRFFREYPDTVCVAMSGTISSKSLKDWAHISEWCLGPYSPVPMRWQELCEWADALDSDVPEQSRMNPGALMEFCEDGENARQGFRRRLVQTPGVVASEENQLGVSLRINSKRDIVIPEEVHNAIQKTKSRWETPNGDIITDAVSLWRHVRELALGFWYRWEPAAPPEWMAARKEWKSYVRDTLKHNRRGLDTELQVWNECERENQTQIWKDWRDIKDTFKINTVAEWIDQFALWWSMDWLRNNEGICWVEHREFGKKLAEYSGFPYYGAGDSRILNTEERSIIASVSAHGEGKNLQRFDKNLVVCPSSSGKTWEQLLGRTHRPGQQADEVTCDVFMHLRDFEETFDKARADARYLEDTYGNSQKLNYADLIGFQKRG